MDHTSPNKQFSEPQGIVLNQDGKSKKVLFVIIALVVLVGALNYFNILPISSLFPQELKEDSNATIAPTSSPDITPTQGKEALISYLSNTLISSRIPQSADISLTQDKTVKQNFRASWQTKEGKVSAKFDISQDSLKIYQFELFFPLVSTMSASIDLAQKITPQFLSLTPKGIWKCRNIKVNGDTYCENFWEEENGDKLGIGLLENEEKDTKTLYVSFCQRSRESEAYFWKACNAEYAETGL